MLAVERIDQQRLYEQVFIFLFSETRVNLVPSLKTYLFLPVLRRLLAPTFSASPPEGAHSTEHIHTYGNIQEKICRAFLQMKQVVRSHAVVST